MSVSRTLSAAATVLAVSTDMLRRSTPKELVSQLVLVLVCVISHAQSNACRNCPLHGHIAEELSGLALVTATNVLPTPQQTPGHQYKARDRNQGPQIGLGRKYKDILTVRRDFVKNKSWIFELYRPVLVEIASVAWLRSCALS